MAHTLLAQWRFIQRVQLDPDLGDIDRRVAFMLLDKYDAAEGFAWPSQEWLALQIGVTDRAVRSAVQRLIAGGWFSQVRRGRGPGVSSHYVPNMENRNDGSSSPAENRNSRSREQEQPFRENRNSRSAKTSYSKPPSKPPMREGASAPRGTRIPPDMDLPDEWSAWAIEQGHRDPGAAWDRFRDHWLAASGAKGVKADWSATWRNWIRKDLEDARTRPARRTSGGTAGLFAAFGAAAARRRD
jgi:hypothetical protein